MTDELNYFDKGIEEKLREYFREMPEIKENEIDERVNAGKEIYDFMMLFFLLFQATEVTNQYQDIDYYISMVNRYYENTINDLGYVVDEYICEYMENYAQEVVNTTFVNKDDEYYTSSERALNIAENEANTLCNYQAYNKAVASGYTHKQWLTKMDNKVRNTHRETNGKIIKINEYFRVGNSLMLFPHDLSKNPDPKEYIHCRCHVKYIKKDSE